MIDLVVVGGGAGCVLAASAFMSWLGPAKSRGRDRSSVSAILANEPPRFTQTAPATPKNAVAAPVPPKELGTAGRSTFLLLDPATAADRFLVYLKAAGIKAATAHEAWLLYGEHCLDDGLEPLSNNVIMAEVAKRVWRGQKRMSGGRPTVYVFDQPPAEPPRKTTLAERRRAGMNRRPVELRAA